MSARSKLLASCGGAPIDAYFRNVSLLLHGDGSNGAQNNTFLDSSTNNFTVTRNGNTTQGSFSPYGSVWSNYFDGSGDYITSPDNAAVQFGNGDFTVEMWVNFSSTSGAQVLIGSRANTGVFAPYQLYYTGGVLYLYGSTNGSSWNIFNGLTVIPSVSAGTWYHVVFVRSGSNFSTYCNGVRQSNSTVSGSLILTSAPVTIGADAGGASPFTGYISNVRMVKGTAVYDPSQTTITVPATPLTAISGTSLLTCQSNRFRDASTNNFTITRNGDVKVTNFGPFAPAVEYTPATNLGSGYYDGNGDYLSVADNTAFVLNASFTLEAWVYPNRDYSTYQTIITKRAGNTPAAWQLFINITDGCLGYYNGTGYFSSAVVPLNAWSHVAAVYDGSNINLYLNGTRVLQSGTTNTDQSTGVKIGYHYSSVAEPFQGYISDVRVVKNASVYTVNFTPPTAPLTAITGTSLLLKTTNAAIVDSSAKNDLETVGNAQISTSVKKFGTGSMAFDGSGDYIRTVAKPEFGFGTGDFTIEYWVYPALTGDSNQVVIDARPSDTATPWLIGHTTAGTIRYYDGSTVRTGGTMSANTWNHVAWTRSGGVNRVFLNGTQVSTYTATQDFGTTRGLNIGGNVLEPYERFTGYIDDLRITKGVARYTANFTPPAAAFPNQ